jgi:hypothetical protein
MATSSHLDLLVHTNVIMIISDCQRLEVKKLHEDATSGTLLFCLDRAPP